MEVVFSRGKGYNICRLEVGEGTGMECPYCKDEMANGYLRTGEEALHWISEADKDLFLGIGRRKVKLYNSKPNSYSTEAFFCEQCKIVIAYTER